MGSKTKADPVFFLSLVGVKDRNGIVDDEEHIFDLYTKLFDFDESDVVFKSAQDLWDWYASQNRGSDKKKVDIYQLVEEFVKQHPNANFVLDECPILPDACKYRVPC